MVDELEMLRASHLIQLTVVALLGLALVMVHSAGMRVDRGMLDPMAFVTSRHTIYATLAITALLVASRFNVRQLCCAHGWGNPLLWLVLLMLGLLTVTVVPGVGMTVNGATRWLTLGPRQWGLTFQPSELAKWSLVLAIPCWCARRRAVMYSFRFGLIPPLLLVGLVCGLIVLEDLGTALLIAMVAICLLLAGGARLWHLLATVPPVCAVAAAVIMYSPYRLARITAFVNPWADPQGIGYHPIQSMVAIAQGRIVGKGLGNSIQKFEYLPGDTTDFLFAIICEELGLGGAALVVGLYLVLLGVGLAILRDSHDLFGRLVALGVMLTLGFQALINIAVVTVVVPTKGIALPLLSAGGTGWVVTAGAVGLLASLDEANRLREEAEDPRNGGVKEPYDLATDPSCLRV